MKSIFKLALMMFATALIMQSCEEDIAVPSVMLDNQEISAKAGEEITIVATVTAAGGFSNLSIQKYWGDDVQGNPEETTTLTNSTYTFTYTVTQDDVEPILKFQFIATDGGGQTSAPVEAVVDVELTKAQILVKYDWLHTSAVREATNDEEIAAHDADNVFRYHEDGTYQLSYGAIAGDFDGLDQYCYWEVNEETGRLIRTRTSFNWGTWIFDVDARDTLDITDLSSTEMVADVILRGLDAFDPTYDPIENYIYKFSAQAKGDNFDPYAPGADDDAGPTAGDCIDF